MTGLPTHRDPPMEQAAAWFVRLDRDDLAPEDLARFEAWHAVPAHAAALARVKGLWADLAAIPHEKRPRAATPPARHRPWRTCGLALAASLALALSFVLDLPTRLRSDLRTGTGETVAGTLPDGSVAVLDSGSAIAIDWSPDRRTIRLLRGEALFTVAPDAARPFVVEAGDGAARALGTKFAVRRDGGGGTVTVLESHVQVSCCTGEEPGITLSPGQQLAYSPAGLGTVRSVDADSETAWARGKLIFTNRPLGQVVAALNRYVPGRIVVHGTALRERRVSGVFSTAAPLAAVEGLEHSLNLRSTRVSPWLIVLHD